MLNSDEYVLLAPGTKLRLMQSCLRLMGAQTGANAIIGVSLSVCRARTGAKGIPQYKHIQEISGTKSLLCQFLLSM